MLKRLTHIALAGCLLLLITAAAAPSPQEAAPAAEKKAEKRPKDQQEYELINKTFKETDAAKRLQYLDEWSEKYKETAFTEERIRFYMASYQQTNQGPKAITSAKELLALVPDDFSASFTITSLTPFLQNSDPATLSDGDAAAKALFEGGIAKQFNPANKPAAVSDAQWSDARKQAEVSANQTRGWVAMQRKQNPEAEQFFTKVLKQNPGSAQVSYWMGQVVLAQANPEKNTLAMYQFARAASYEGPGALNAEGRQKIFETVGVNVTIPPAMAARYARANLARKTKLKITVKVTGFDFLPPPGEGLRLPFAIGELHCELISLEYK